jgi:glycosyltransferase involved in cell wall biosynthesis
MGDSPKISVVLTCYNLGRYLDEAVDSVLAQTCQDFEIVVVDDGSTDRDTVDLLSDYRRPRTRVVHIENRGLPGARNEGIRQTAGPYVCTLDADDRLEKTYFEKAAAVLDRDPSVAFVSHWLRTFGDEEREWRPESADFPALLDMNSINGAALVRREALMAVGLFDETMRDGCEDWDLWISMVERGLQGVILPEVLFFYRRRPDSMSRVMMQGDTHVGLYRRLIEKHRASFETHLVELLLRREIDWVTVLGEAYDLELDCDTALGPEIERLRDALRMAQHKQERLEWRRDAGTELARRAQTIADRDAEIARLQAAAAGREAERSRLQQEIAEHEAELGRLQQVSAAQEAELGSLHEVTAEQQAELGRLQQRIVETESETTRQREAIARQTVEIERRGQAIAERDSHLHHLAARATQLEAELSLDREGIAGLKYEIHALRSSLSWRLTRPLRSVYSWLFERG